MKHLDTKSIIRKTREDYNRIASHFSGTRYDVWPELEQFQNLIKDGQKVLDWGCGNGRLFLMLQDKKIKYFGVDQSEELIKIAKKKYSSEIKKGKAKFFLVGDKNKKFVDDFFEVVFMIASFHHLPDEETRLELLKKTYKEMKSDGKLIITVWNLSSSWGKNKKKKGEIEEYAPGDFLVPWKDPEGKILAKRYYHNFSEKELKKLVSSVGFKIKKIGYHDNNNWSDKKTGRNLILIAEK